MNGSLLGFHEPSATAERVEDEEALQDKSGGITLVLGHLRLACKPEQASASLRRRSTTSSINSLPTVCRRLQVSGRLCWGRRTNARSDHGRNLHNGQSSLPVGILLMHILLAASSLPLTRAGSSWVSDDSLNTTCVSTHSQGGRGF